ncbi:MAG: polyhydroxyalkanoate synthesis repressor PhaR [Alphaproteobacteria bacterium]|nr:MAG: polyhydroxyalkanoate synthesis repressor PhaR [Alphaproteobacteria bacterium]
MTTAPAPSSPPVLIKKYPNRRLYNTASSSYVTLEYLGQMVRDGVDFVVCDAKSGDDITRSVLTQIIVEHENSGHSLLPEGFLRQLISLYGDNLGWLVPRYLEHSLQVFSGNQEKIRDYVQDTVGGLLPFSRPLQEMGREVSRQNLEMVERTMRLFNPFAAGADEASKVEAKSVLDTLSRAQLISRVTELEAHLRSLASFGSHAVASNKSSVTSPKTSKRAKKTKDS